MPYNQRLDAFCFHNLHCVYEKRFAHPDVLLGTHEIPIPVESLRDVPFIPGNGDGEAGWSIQLVTLYLTITVSAANIPPTIILNNPPEISTKGDDTPTEGTVKPSMAPDFGGPIQSTTPEPLLPPPRHLAVETGTTMPHGQAEMSPTMNTLNALRRTDVAKLIDLSGPWEGVVGRFK